VSVRSEWDERRSFADEPGIPSGPEEHESKEGVPFIK